MKEHFKGTLRLQKGREKPVQNRHPWVFSGAVQRVEGQPKPGELVRIANTGGQYLATAYYNPHSQIQGRILSWQEDEVIDETFWRKRLERAISSRLALQLAPHTTAVRLVNAEADGLPGLVVDQYNEVLVLQCQTWGIDQRKQMLAEILADLLRPDAILERSDLSARQKEGLAEATGVLWGTPPAGSLHFLENGLTFEVNLQEGHKTGFYLDQRDNRALLGQGRWVAGKEVLNVFAYTGGFAVYAAAGGAQKITNVDSSASVLELAQRNVNRVANRPQDEYVAADAFQLLRQYRTKQRLFDVVVLDPPKFANSQGDVTRATRGYKDINMLGLHLLRPGGLLATFSCSGLISADLFQKVLFGAAVDAGREVQILQVLSQASDHPVSLTFPESAYLKGFLCRVW